MRRDRLLGIAIITLTSILWGTTGTAASMSVASPLAIGAAALGIGGLLQAAIAIPELRLHVPDLSRNRELVLLGGFAVAIYPLAFYSSMHLAGVAVGSVVSLGSAPLVTGLLELLIERKSLSRWWMIAATIGVIGAVLLCLARMQEPLGDATPTMIGVGFGLIAGATYAIYSWSARGLICRLPRGASMGAVFGVGGALLMPVLAITGGSLVASWDAFLPAVYIALIPMFLGYVAFGYGLQLVDARTATTVTLTEPAVAAVLAVIVVGERLSLPGWIGLGVIVLAMLVLVFAPEQSADARKANLPDASPAVAASE